MSDASSVPLVLSGEKILITGPAGQIAFPLARHLVADNEVWGIARFSGADDRARVDALGVTTVVCDIATGEFTGVPDDFTYVVHLAAFQGPGLDFDHAITVNAEGTGLLLAHCRNAKAALVMSTHSASPRVSATSRPATSRGCPTTSRTSCTSPRSRAPATTSTTRSP